MEHTVYFGEQNTGLQVGVSNASITANFYSRTERPETPPRPLSTVPFRRDPDFVERGTLLDQIHEKCLTPASRIALVGLGGVGKSQLAIEYAHRIREHSPETWVFWIHGSNAARFEQGFREIADRVKITDRRDPRANIYRLVHDWLQDSRKGRWVLILDNVDDDHFLRRAPFISQGLAERDKDRSMDRPLWAYLPQSAHGSMMMTTRNRAVALRMVEERDIITVDPMDKIHAQTLFEAKLGIAEDTKDIMELAAALEYMPLAIVQAASYIRQRTPRLSVKQYLQQLESSDYRKLSLLEDEEGQLRRDWEARNSIIRTWQISFDHILQERPSAANLLALMSFFDRQGIHQCLLQDFSQNESSNNNQERHSEAVDSCKMDSANALVQCDVDDRFEDNIRILRNFSFVTVNADAASFQMHRLVQLAMQKWLEAHGQLERWKLSFIRSLAREFPWWDGGNWERCQMLFPHTKLAMSQQLDTEDSLAMLLHNAASYALMKRNMNEAEQMAVKALKLRETLFGAESAETLNSIGLMGSVLADQGKYDEAIALQQQAAADFEKLLGASDPNTVMSLNNLGLTLTSHGKYKEAEGMLRKCLAGCEKILGADHYTTLLCVNNLGSVLSVQGKYVEAERLHRQALSGFETTWGNRHYDTLVSIDLLAGVLMNRNRNEEAEMLFRKAIAGSEKLLGADHLHTLRCIGNLGTVLAAQGKYVEAELLHRQALSGVERRWGDDELLIFTKMDILFGCLKKKEGHAYGKIRQPRALPWFASMSKVGHRNGLMTTSMLGSALRDQGKYVEDFFRKLLIGYRQRLRPDHPMIIRAMSHLSTALMWQGKFQEAEVLLQQALTSCQGVLNEDHPDNLTRLGNLGSALAGQGKHKDAEEMHRRALAGREKMLGSDHPHTLLSMKHLAYSLWMQDRNVEAIELLQSVVRLQCQSLGPKHPQTIDSMTVLRQYQRWNRRTYPKMKPPNGCVVS